MSKSHSLANVAVGLTTTMQPVHARPKADTPFCVAILGDFSGRTNRGLVQPSATIAARRPILVDRDNLDATLAQQKVEIILQVEGQETNEVVLRFNSLDDFHPDRIFQSVKLFEALRGTRSRLKNPATFGEAAEEVRSWARPSLQPVQPPAPEPAPERSPLSVEGLFDEILDETQAQVRHPAGGIDWVAMVREIAAPYSVPGADPQLPQLIGCVDSAIAALISRRSRLHGVPWISWCAASKPTPN